MENFHLFSKYAICYGVFFLLTYISKLNKGHKLFDEDGPVRNPGILIGLQLAGVLWLGILPVSIIHQPFTIIVFGKYLPELYKVLTLYILLMVSVFMAWRLSVERFNGIIKNNGFTRLSKRFIYSYCLLRIVFLSGYEIFFRGYLLTDCVAGFGIFWAVVINVTLYALLHVVDERKEFLACIPFGILVCLICIWFGEAWPAVIIHIVFSVTYEFTLSKKFSTPINVII